MPLRFGVLFLLSLLFSFFDQKNGIGKIVRLDSGEDENGESEAKSIGRDKRNRIGIFPALFSFLFFFSSFFSTSTVEKRGRKLDTSNAIFFIDLPPIHPFFIARSADRCSKRPTWFHVENYSNRVRIFSFSPRSYLHIFFSVWKCWKTFLDRDNPF